jgi:beta-mannosidase
LDSTSRRVGFRSVDLLQEPDGAGSSFELRVNGRPVWVRGVNWIPDDILPERVDAARYGERLTQAADAGVNFVRVWGGGRYEADDFYDVCDELGLLVQQDFLFACAAYPEGEAAEAEVVAEASEAIERLRHRASLAIWCGNNESLSEHADRDWATRLAGRGWGKRYYHVVLPGLVTELDGHRPYVPGSPFSPDDRHPNSLDSGTAHLWEVWNRLDYAHYEDYAPRFVAEFGYQGPAVLPTLVEAVGDSALDPSDPSLALHQKAGGGNEKLQAGLDRHFPSAAQSGLGWYLASALTQARAVSVGARHFRALDRCGGAIYWQLNDCWPAISWSVVDVRGRRKLSWYALREAFADRLLVLARAGTGLSLVALNDTDLPWRTEALVRTFSADAERTARPTALNVPPRGRAVLPLGLSANAELVLVDADGQRAGRWLADDLALDLPPHDAEVRHERRPGGIQVSLRARTLIRDAWLPAELAVPDAVVEPQLVTLCPGESLTFDVSLPPGVTGDGVDWADLVWSDNRLRRLAQPVT